MYMSATISIDPSHLTHVRRRPTKGFRRLAELLTGNLLSEKDEHETFTALSILQETNVALRSVGVTDVVTFSKDGEVLYDDKESSDQNDMSAAIDSLARHRSLEPTGVFTEMSLMLEHHLTRMALIIEIRIRRVHEIGAYPIRITINGLDSQFQSAAHEGTLNARLEEVFATQSSYDGYTDNLRGEFETFVDSLEGAIRSKMQVDHVHRRINANVVRPGLDVPPSIELANKSENQNQPHPSSTHDSPPMLQRYGAGADMMMYVWLWSSMMHSHNTYCHNTTIVGESGQPAFTVGDTGFNAAETQTLDPDAPLELPSCPLEDVSPSLGEIDSDSSFEMLDTGNADESTKSGWMDYFSFGDVASNDSPSSCASDGGDGSSCGSGCGSGCSS